MEKFVERPRHIEVQILGTEGKGFTHSSGCLEGGLSRPAGKQKGEQFGTGQCSFCSSPCPSFLPPRENAVGGASITQSILTALG